MTAVSGMRWNLPGASGILTLRCQHAALRWEQIWTPTHTQAPVPDQTASSY